MAKVETKLNIGEKGFYLDDNHVVEGTITYIEILLKSKFIGFNVNKLEADTPLIIYHTKQDKRDEKTIFATKQELLDSL